MPASSTLLNNPRSQEDRLYARIIWRLIPFLFVLYLFSYIDRLNIGFAKFQMQSDLGWTDGVYGTGAGLCFIGMAVFGVPSNIMLHRVGTRQWISLMMITWGICCMATMFVHTAFSFYLLRFLLGVAEAAFYPGLCLYLTYWFPLNRRAHVIALFLTALPAAGILGGPLAGWIMHTFQGIHGWEAWQWLFLLEGIPTVILGVLVTFLLPNSVDEARWVNDADKALLKQKLDQDPPVESDLSFWQVAMHPRVLHVCLVAFFGAVGVYGVTFWLPQMIKNAGVANVQAVGFYSTIPYIFALAMMVTVGKATDRSGRRSRNYTLCACVAIVGWFLAILGEHRLWLALLGTSLAAGGNMTSLALLGAIKSEFIGGRAAATGFAIMNSVGLAGGALGPYAVGKFSDWSGSLLGGLYFIIACTLGAGILLQIRTFHRRSKVAIPG